MRANADNGDDAAKARHLGAEGIGLCRTEHMFLGDRRVLIERVILADSSEAQKAALDALLPLQRADFVELLTVMDGLPTTIRLLDPPLHEFLPDRADLMVRVALAEERGSVDDSDVRLLAAVNRLHESNPMLGLVVWRLGLTVPGLFALEVRAIAEAAAMSSWLGWVFLGHGVGHERLGRFLWASGHLEQSAIEFEAAAALLAETPGAEAAAVHGGWSGRVDARPLRLCRGAARRVVELLAEPTTDPVAWAMARPCSDRRGPPRRPRPGLCCAVKRWRRHRTR